MLSLRLGKIVREKATEGPGEDQTQLLSNTARSLEPSASTLPFQAPNSRPFASEANLASAELLPSSDVMLQSPDKIAYSSLPLRGRASAAAASHHLTRCVEADSFFSLLLHECRSCIACC